MKKRVAFLASGGGSNFQALLQAMAGPEYPAEPVLLFSDKPASGCVEKARAAGVPVALLDPGAFPDRESFDRAAADLIRAARPDLLCLAGYMRILTPAFVAAFRGRMLNIHPALLPDFGGPGMYGHRVHEAVIRAGVPRSGATVHWVTEGVDAGPILDRFEVPVLPGDTAGTLAARVLEAEHRLYPRALRKACDETGS